MISCFVAQSITDSFDRSYGIVEQGINLARVYECQIPKELNDSFQKFFISLSQLKDAIDLAYQSRDQLCQKFAIDLDKSTQNLQEKAIACRDEGMNLKIFNVSSNPTEMQSFLKQLADSVQNLSDLSAQYESYSSQFSLATTKKASIAVIKADIDTKRDLWNAFVSWKNQEKYVNQTNILGRNHSNHETNLSLYVELGDNKVMAR